MANRYNSILNIPGYNALPIDALLQISQAKDKEIQGTIDNNALQLQQFGNLQTVTDPDTDYTKQKLNDANVQLQEIAKLDVTSPEGQAKFNTLVQSLGSDPGLIYGQQRTRAFHDNQEQIQKLTDAGKYNEARALQYQLDFAAFNGRQDINEAVNSRDLTKSANIQPGYDINDDKFKAFNALKAHNLLDPNIIQNLQNGYSFTDQGVDPTTIFNAISNTLSDKAQEQYLADFKYQKYQNGELNDFNKLSPQEQQMELSTYMYNDIAGFANTYKYDNPDLVKDANGNSVKGNSGSGKSNGAIGGNNVLGLVNDKIGTTIADKLDFTGGFFDTDLGAFVKSPLPPTRGEDVGKYIASLSEAYRNKVDTDGFIKSTELDKFTKSHLQQYSTIRHNIEAIYKKYTEGKATASEKQLLFAGADSYYRNLNKKIENSYTPYIDKDEDGDITSSPIKYPSWEQHTFIDKNTGKQVAGKDLFSDNGKDDAMLLYGQYHGASGLELLSDEPGNRAKIATGFEAKFTDSKGKVHEYIMLNPNKISNQEMVNTVTSSSELTPELKIPVNKDYTVTYMEGINGGYFITDKQGNQLTLNGNQEVELNKSNKKIPTSKAVTDGILNGLLQVESGEYTPTQQSPQYVPQQNLPVKTTFNSSTNTIKGNTPAIRNNNPGNIRNIKGDFIKYNNMSEGLDGLKDYVKRAMTGRHKSYNPNNSILDFSKIYSPESDGNDPVSKANSIARDLGVSPNTPIKELVDKLDTFIQAIIKTEDGNLYNQLYSI